MRVMPSFDLLGGKVVRLQRGDFATARVYGDPEALYDDLGFASATAPLHVVDLEGSRSGKPCETETVRRLARRGVVMQVGGGIRSLDDAARWFDAGAQAIVAGSAAADDADLFATLVERFGPGRVVAAVDVREGRVRVAGWQRDASEPLDAVLHRLAALDIPILMTDISRDGVLQGPAFGLYRDVLRRHRLTIIASGGVTTSADVAALARIDGVAGCVIGKALLDRRFTLNDALQRVAERDAVPERIIPCLDVDNGRVVKGVNFANIRDAGDPVDCARRYETEGADELVILDIGATDAKRETALETVRRVADTLFIPLTVGGGVRTVEDFRALLRAGADRVAINTAALRNPQLIADCAAEFGVQAVVLSCDARRDGSRWRAAVRGGKELTDVDAVDWCMRAEELGAGEILLTSVDRDGTNAGYDLALLRAVTSRVDIGVIASGGAGALPHFREAIEDGGVRAVLAASLLHDGILTVADIKHYLTNEGIPMRW